jgi:hypothetical protein
LHPLSVVVAIQTTAGIERIPPDVKKLGYALETLLLGESGELALMLYKSVIALPVPVRLLMHLHFDLDAFVDGLNHNALLRRI